MKTPEVSVLSLGCSKNLVDSECLARRFADAGFKVRFADGLVPDGSVFVINTCGFIGDAKEESVNTLLEALQMKSDGGIAGVYAMGCLTERYRSELAEEMPELDGIYGKFDWTSLVGDLSGRFVEVDKPWQRKLSTAPHYTYLKISEGCNRFCAFCAIPLITGRHHSRPVEEIIDEVRTLAASGTREFNIIAQDLSSYGRDIGNGSSQLALLLEKMASISGVEMIRLHYAYPADFPYDILPVMARHANICNYLDIALQHIDDQVLTNMRRHIDGKATRALLDRIRAEVPCIHIRTTMMVGFPGEDDAAFERLLDFVAEQRFERMGAFAYCEEDGTYAAGHLSDGIPEEVKQKRLDRLMALQQDIAFDHAESKVGKTLRVIVDEYDGSRFVGRTEYDSPEVDCCVFIDPDNRIEVGGIYEVNIYASEGFDLLGRIAK